MDPALLRTPRLVLPRYAAAVIAAAVVSCAPLHALAGPNTEVEPNNALPGTSPTSGPQLVPGGTIVGTIMPSDSDFIRVTVPSVPPAGAFTRSRHTFELVTAGDATLDLIEPATGRILASSDDVPLVAPGAGPGSSRCVFDLVEQSPSPTEWILLVRGFWNDGTFDYEVRYSVEHDVPIRPISMPAFTPIESIESIGPGDAHWYAVTLAEAGWLRVSVEPMSPFPPDTAFAVFNELGQCVVFADDEFGISAEGWQSQGQDLIGTMYVVVAPSTMRTTFGMLPRTESAPRLWQREGVSAGERAGWTFPPGPGSTRQPGGSYRVTFERGTPPPPCPADLDQNGGIDGGDLSTFFSAYEAGEPLADLDANGGIDGGDLSFFFQHYEAGC